jgi:UDPglucose--hexose-1-phosphate uridylyltransferase
VLYTSEHDATLASLGVDGVRRVIDLWADRTAALAARDDVDYVLVFENRGAEVGATIEHPHGQIYAYDHVPARPARLLAAGFQFSFPEWGSACRDLVADWRRNSAVE